MALVSGGAAERSEENGPSHHLHGPGNRWALKTPNCLNGSTLKGAGTPDPVTV